MKSSVAATHDNVPTRTAIEANRIRRNDSPTEPLSHVRHHPPCGKLAQLNVGQPNYYGAVLREIFRKLLEEHRADPILDALAPAAGFRSAFFKQLMFFLCLQSSDSTRDRTAFTI